MRSQQETEDLESAQLSSLPHPCGGPKPATCEGPEPGGSLSAFRESLSECPRSCAEGPQGQAGAWFQLETQGGPSSTYPERKLCLDRVPQMPPPTLALAEILT